MSHSGRIGIALADFAPISAFCFLLSAFAWCWLRRSGCWMLDVRCSMFALILCFFSSSAFASRGFARPFCILRHFCGGTIQVRGKVGAPFEPHRSARLAGTLNTSLLELSWGAGSSRFRSNSYAPLVNVGDGLSVAVPPAGGPPFALLTFQIAEFREDFLCKRARQTESWRDRIIQRERPGASSQ